jgi:hypothetical protein
MERSVSHIRRVDPGQCKDKSYYNYYGFKTYNDKNIYYYNFKTQSGDRSRTIHGSRVRLTWFDLNWRKNKNNYYYNFKNKFRGQPEVRPEL